MRGTTRTIEKEGMVEIHLTLIIILPGLHRIPFGEYFKKWELKIKKHILFS